MNVHVPDREMIRHEDLLYCISTWRRRRHPGSASFVVDKASLYSFAPTLQMSLATSMDTEIGMRPLKYQSAPSTLARVLETWLGKTQWASRRGSLQARTILQVHCLDTRRISGTTH
jgi:hypothetical protein